MKFILVLLSLFVFSFAEGYTLIRAKRVPGFEPHRMFKTVLIDSSGSVRMLIRDEQTGRERVVSMASLANYSMISLRADVRKVKSRTQLVDLDPQGPECMDPPEYEVDVYKNGRMKKIYRSANCHEFRLEDFAGEKSIQISLGFLEL